MTLDHEVPQPSRGLVPEVAERSEQVRDLHTGAANRLPHLADEHLLELLSARLRPLDQRVQMGDARVEGGPLPAAEGSRSRQGGAVDRSLAAQGDAPDHRAAVGRGDVDAGLAGKGNGTTVDEVESPGHSSPP